MELFGRCFRYEIFSKLLIELKDAVLKYPDEVKYRRETEVRSLTFDDKYKIIRRNLQNIANGYSCYYSDYIPENILRNVLKKYNKNLNPTEILGIVDTSILGNGKPDCLFTDKGFYWSESLSAVQYISYDNINTIVCIKDNEDASDDYLVIINHFDMKAQYVRYNSLKKEPLEKILEQLQTSVSMSKNQDLNPFQAKYEWINSYLKETKLVKENDKVRISFVEFEDKPCVYKIYFDRDITPLYKEIEKCGRFVNLAKIYEYVCYDGNTHILEERLVGETLAEIIVIHQ